MTGLAAFLVTALVNNAPGIGGEAPVAAELTAHKLLSMSGPERRRVLSTLSREELGGLFVAPLPPSLVAMCKAGLAELGTYAVRLQKTERVEDGALERQDIDLTVRPSPLAIRGDFGEGPARGRKLLYNQELQAGAIRVREPGFFGIFGGIWLDLDSSTMRKQSSRPVTDLGFAVPVAHVAHDFALASTAKDIRTDIEGLDAANRLCLRIRSPRGAQLFADHMRICFDLGLGLPVVIESYGASGLAESFVFSNVKPRVKVDSAFFTLEGAGL